MLMTGVSPLPYWFICRLKAKVMQLDCSLIKVRYVSVKKKRDKTRR